MALSSGREPLLHHTRTSLTPSPKKVSSLDDIIEMSIGRFSTAQLLQSFLVSLAWTFDAQQTFINIFTDAQPSWHYTHSYDDRGGSHGDSSSICQLPNDAWAWDRDTSASVVSEWNLVCADSALAGLPASSFFAGCLFGGFLLAHVADTWLGRKNMLIASCFAMSVTGLATALSPNIWLYSLLRFLSGCGRATIGTCALVLSTELVGKRWRGEVGIIGFFCFTFGFLTLPAMAYLSRAYSWRFLYLVSSLPALFYCILVKFMVFESPRWLFVRGRKEEAFTTLRTISGFDSETLDFDEFASMSIGEETLHASSAMRVLWHSPWARRRLSTVMLVGIGIGMVYYGMPFGLDNLNFKNLYLSVTFNALAELPSALVTFFLISKFNRRSSVLFSCMVSGIASLFCVFLKGNNLLQMVAELVSFFSACTALNVVMIYCLELFPTCVRNSALGLLRQAIVFAGIFSPMLVVAGGKEGFTSFGIFGLMIGGCGLFVVSLPETKGSDYCDTMQEQEYKEIYACKEDSGA